MFFIVDGGTMTIGYNADDRHRHTVHVASVRRDAAAVHCGDPEPDLAAGGMTAIWKTNPSGFWR